MNIELVSEEKDFLVLNKPTGIEMHNSNSSSTSAFINCQNGLGFISLLRNEYNDSELYPVHRLDKVTSGLLIVAKGKQANRALSQKFQNREVNKFYFAIGGAKPNKKQGAIIGDMSATRGGSWKLMRTKHNPAITYFFSYGLGNGVRGYILKPLTGKTHQLRVALKSMGAPILGDERYGGQSSDRTYLHALALKFQFADRDFSYLYSPNEGAVFKSENVQSVLHKISDPADLAWPDPFKSYDC